MQEYADVSYGVISTTLNQVSYPLELLRISMESFCNSEQSWMFLFSSRISMGHERKTQLHVATRALVTITIWLGTFVDFFARLDHHPQHPLFLHISEPSPSLFYLLHCPRLPPAPSAIKPKVGTFSPISVRSPPGSSCRSGRRAQASMTCWYRASSKGDPKRMLSFSVAFWIHAC